MQKYQNTFWPLMQRFYDVGVLNDCIMGKIVSGFLSPFVAPRADLDYKLGRVKIEIHGEDANVTLPILKEDPINQLFFRKIWRHQVRLAERVE